MNKDQRIRPTKTRGSALLAAMVAVGICGFIGASMAAYYESFTRQSRQVYVRALLTSVDNKIRTLAMQPYAYACADQRAGATSGNQLDGIGSCVIRRSYFAAVERTIVPGACAPSNPCGIRLVFKAAAGDPPLDFTTMTNPNTGEAERTGLFAYALVYEGTDFALRPGGYDLNQASVGMPVPREVLQSEAFDCSRVDPTKPVFGGFDNGTGKPICRGFNECSVKTYGTGISFRRLDANGNLELKCRALETPDKVADCGGSGQRKIDGLRFADGTLSATCGDLPIAPLNASPVIPTPPPNPIGGTCGPSGGLTLASAPTGNLCSAGSASAVTGSGPWTWTCAGTNGGSSATCSAAMTPVIVPCAANETRDANGVCQPTPGGFWYPAGMGAMGPIINAGLATQDQFYSNIWPSGGDCPKALFYSPGPGTVSCPVAGKTCVHYAGTIGGARSGSAFAVYRCK